MNDAATVRCCQCIGDLQSDQQRGLQFKRTDVLTFYKLHGDEMNALYFVQIVDGADVWMVQRRGEARFAFKSLEVCFFRAKLRRYYLDDDRVAQLEVGSFVDRALPAHAELVRDAIVAERFT